MEGWFPVQRELLSSDFWLSEKFTCAQAWIDLIGLANHKDGMIRPRGVRVPVKRGQVGWSQVKLAERWKWSRKRVRRFLNELESTQQIAQQKRNQFYW